MIVHHVFPYDPGHLGLSPEQWWRGQLLRWPLGAVAESRLAPQTVVHVISRGTRPPVHIRPGRLDLRIHNTGYSNSRWHGWGDDWSMSLGRALRHAGHEDIVVIHLEGYAAARLCLRYAHNARCVLVLHGRGTGSLAEHEAADATVVLNDASRNELLKAGLLGTRLIALVPSVDRTQFIASGEPEHSPPLLGYVGRLEESKGAFELPAVIRALADLDMRLECVGTAPGAANVRRTELAFYGTSVVLCGELSAAEVASKMRRWSALILPSYTEGFPLVALEALCSGLPVVAVEGVLPPTLETRRGVWVGPRAQMAERVRLAVMDRAAPDATWILDHRQGGEAWDAIYASLPRWHHRSRPSARPLLGRMKRLRLASTTSVA